MAIEGGIAALALPAGVAITPSLIWDLRDALERAAGEETVRALVFSIAGRAAAGDCDFTPEALAAVLAEPPSWQPPQMLAALRVPTLAALGGCVAGPLLELALACDLRIAADDATFLFPPLAGGRFPSWGGTQRLPRIVGLGRALELMLLAEPLEAPAALACGLVTRLVPPDQLTAEARRIAGGWLSGAPHALAYAKEAVRQGGDLPLDHALRLEWDLAVLLETTRDRAEGIRAFLEKRPPQFRGE